MTRLNEFYPCIQGEGKFTGTPMWLIRLQGCDVGCPWCDTKESWREGGKEVEPATFIPALSATNPAIRWAMITGGEPCLQDLKPLTTALYAAGLHTSLETSGTEPLSGTFDWITISPKINMPGKKRVLVEVLRQADEVKMPVGCQLDIDNLLDVLKHCRQGVRVSLQPLSTSKAATELCYKTCLERGWNLSLQTHKWIGAK